MLDIMRKYGLYANLNKCRFYKNKVYFLGYVILAQEVKIEDKRIKAMKNGPKLTLVYDIQMFINFANFYRGFI